jgi:twitching motility two-component system response regulator PilG
MSSSKRTFSVTTIGISDSERKILTNIFKLSLYRTRSYILKETGTASETAEIAIIDLKENIVNDQWQSFNTRRSHIPAVIVTQEPPSQFQPYCIRRPFVASRVLGVLDQVSIKEHSFIPEIVIGEETSSLDRSTELVKQTVTQTAEAGSRSKGYLALVVDDSLPVRKQIELELKLLGVNADFAETGEQAFKLLDNKSYDIVFLDVVLPGIDGYQVCKTIKKDIMMKQTPVIMLTGKSSPFDRVRGTFAGCDTYLTKPVAHESFQEVVKKYLA